MYYLINGTYIVKAENIQEASDIVTSTTPTTFDSIYVFMSEPLLSVLIDRLNLSEKLPGITNHLNLYGIVGVKRLPINNWVIVSNISLEDY